MSRRLSTFLLLGLYVALMLATPMVSSAQERNSVAELEEIIVTARRREESLLAAPLSVAALSADTMRENEVYDIEGVGEFVPSLPV